MLLLCLVPVFALYGIYQMKELKGLLLIRPHLIITYVDVNAWREAYDEVRLKINCTKRTVLYHAVSRRTWKGQAPTYEAEGPVLM